MQAKAKPIPDGFNTLTPHLVIKGAAAAIDFYKKAFGAEELTRLNAPDGKLMHADLKIGNSHLFLVDEFPEMQSLGPLSRGGTTATVHVYVTDVDAAFKRAVDAGAKVLMPLADMFWGDRYGLIVDPYGHTWSLATHTKDLTPQQIAEGFKNACGSGPCPS